MSDPDETWVPSVNSPTTDRAEARRRSSAIRRRLEGPPRAPLSLLLLQLVFCGPLSLLFIALAIHLTIRVVRQLVWGIPPIEYVGCAPCEVLLTPADAVGLVTLSGLGFWTLSVTVGAVRSLRIRARQWLGSSFGQTPSPKFS